MTYPVKLSQYLPVGQSVSVPFSPLKAGLVKAIVTAGWNPADTPPPSEGQPTTFPMQVRLDIFKPGAASPTATRADGKTVGSDPKRDLGKPQVTLWADAMAGPADVGLGEGSDALAFLPVSMFGDGTTQIVQLRNLNGRLGMAVYTPQPGGGYAERWSTRNNGQGAGALAFVPVTMNGDGKTQIVQMWNNAGRLGLVVHSPRADGSFAVFWGTSDAGASADAIAFLPVTMNGDGKTQIVQLSSSGTRLAFSIYAPQADGSYRLASSVVSPQGAGAVKFLTADMHGDGKTRIVQLWNNGGRLAFTTYAPQGVGYSISGATMDAGQSADAIAFLPVCMHGDRKTQIVQLWKNGTRLGMTVYGPGTQDTWVRLWSTADIGQGAPALAFLPVTMNGDGKTQLVQLWDNNGRLGAIVYAPQPDGSYAFTSGTGDAGGPSAALAFLPVTVKPGGRTQLAQMVDRGGQLGMTTYAPQTGGSYAAAWSLLPAQWSVRLTNTGAAPILCELTVRYQQVAGNLGKIDHVVVLMMENRSFDHMLGYLSLEQGRTDVEGLAAGMFNLDDNGQRQYVHHRTGDYFSNDPGHGAERVAVQLNYLPPAPPGTPATTGSNQGFVHDFTDVLKSAMDVLPPVTTGLTNLGEIAGGDTHDIVFRPTCPGPVTILCNVDRKIVRSESGKLGSVTLKRPGKVAITQLFPLSAQPGMGLQYTATADDLAVPGDWVCTIFNGTDEKADFGTAISYVLIAHDTSLQELPNAVMGYHNATDLPAYDMLAREYAICDHWFAALPTDTWPNRLYALGGGSEGLKTTPSTEEVIAQPPNFRQQTIFEVLQNRGEDWKIFFNDIPFALVYGRLAQDAAYTKRMRAFSNGDGADLQHAVESGNLPSLSWIDPNFSDLREIAAAASDDHPPGGISNGQRLVSQLYSMLSSSPAWTKTAFVVIYDEHGGFFDHVLPPGQPDSPAGRPPDDDATQRHYGVRVPALVASPWVPQGSVCKTVFDHTSVLATVLHRFCPDAAADMGTRAAHANDLSAVLTRTSPRVDVPKMPKLAAPPVAAAPVRMPNSFGAVLRAAIFGY